MTLRVCLAGVTGWIGKPLSIAIAEAADLSLVAAVSRSASGKRAAGVVGDNRLDVTISGSVDDALRIPSDVFVDYTNANVVKDNVLAAIRAHRYIVIGSSGLTDADFAEIDEAAQESAVGVIAVGNFAISAALLSRFAREAARHMPSWEIIDYAHDGKVDAPSGTARELAWNLSQVGNPTSAVPLEKVTGVRESRGATVSGSQIHSIRLPGHTIGLDVIFGREDERLTIRYEGGTGAAPYIAGTLAAIRRVRDFRGVVRGLDAIL